MCRDNEVLSGESLMPLDGMMGGEEPRAPWCASCKAPILNGQRRVHIRFENDPHGYKGLTGEYHKECSKPFISLARAINVMSFSRF